VLPSLFSPPPRLIPWMLPLSSFPSALLEQLAGNGNTFSFLPQLVIASHLPFCQRVLAVRSFLFLFNSPLHSRIFDSLTNHLFFLLAIVPPFEFTPTFPPLLKRQTAPPPQDPPRGFFSIMGIAFALGSSTPRSLCLESP